MHWQKWPKCLSEHVLQLFSLFTKCAPLNGELLINSQKVQPRAFFVSTSRFLKYKVNGLTLFSGLTRIKSPHRLLYLAQGQSH